MSKYIIVTTFCDKENIANEITDKLLEKKLVAGCQITKVRSKFWWKEISKEITEYKIDLTTKESLFKEIEKEIYNIHDYEIPAISACEIINGNEAFLDWIKKNTK